MTSTQKIIRLLRRECPEADISMAGSGHIVLRLPNGKIVTAASTPSDEHFFLKKVKADIRRATRGDR